jgi:hypothetical protein
MANRKYSKYVFSDFDTVEKKMGYTFPHFEGKMHTFVWDKFWHKAEFSKIWGEMDLHYNVGAKHGLGAEGISLVTGDTVFGNTKEGDVLFQLGVHKHTADEIFFVFGTDPTRPGKLGGEYEFYLGAGEDAERYTFDTNTIIYVPAGVFHNPNGLVSIDDPSHPIAQVMVLLAPGHFGNISEYAEDENGNRIYPPGLEEIRR